MVQILLDEWHSKTYHYWTVLELNFYPESKILFFFCDDADSGNLSHFVSFHCVFQPWKTHSKSFHKINFTIIKVSQQKSSTGPRLMGLPDEHLILGSDPAVLSSPSFKETVLWDRFQQCWRKFTDVGLNKCCGWFFNFSEAPLILGWNKTSSFR